MSEPTPERWLPVPGYEGFYEVSDLGRVRTVPRIDGMGRFVRARIRKPQWHGHYLGLRLSVRGEITGRYLHRMVAAAFLGPCPDGMEVLHGDDDRMNNRLSNLRYDTRAANMGEAAERDRTAFGDRNGMAKLSDELVAAIRTDLAAGVTGKDAAQRYGMSKAQISRIRTGKAWARQSPQR